MPVQLSHHEDQSAAVLTARAGDGRTVQIATPIALKNSTALGKQISALLSAVEAQSDTLSARAGDLSPAGFSKAAGEGFAKVAGSYRDVQAAVVAERNRLAGQATKYRTPTFDLADAAGAIQRAETRAWLRSLKPVDAFSAAHADRAVLDAALERPETLGLSADLIEKLRDRREELALRDAYATTWRIQPSADNPAADGYDAARAETAANEALAASRSQREDVAAAERVLKDAVNFVALTADMTANDAFQLLTRAA